MKTAYPRVPFLIVATDGDVEAINQIVKHYRGYTKRSLRRMTDEYGNFIWLLMKPYVAEWNETHL